MLASLVEEVRHPRDGRVTTFICNSQFAAHVFSLCLSVSLSLPDWEPCFARSVATRRSPGRLLYPPGCVIQDRTSDEACCSRRSIVWRDGLSSASDDGTRSIRRRNTLHPTTEHAPSKGDVGSSENQACCLYHRKCPCYRKEGMFLQYVSSRIWETGVRHALLKM